MTATQKHDIIPVCTTVLSADQQPKEDIMLDQQKITILYCRLSNEDAQDGESNSIANQREYLTRYARNHGYTNLKILVDDGSVVGIGTHEELINTCEVYREIYDSQYKRTN